VAVWATGVWEADVWYATTWDGCDGEAQPEPEEEVVAAVTGGGGSSGRGARGRAAWMPKGRTVVDLDRPRKKRRPRKDDEPIPQPKRVPVTPMAVRDPVVLPPPRPSVVIAPAVPEEYRSAAETMDGTNYYIEAAKQAKARRAKEDEDAIEYLLNSLGDLL
jgi:hypothetical protein